MQKMTHAEWKAEGQRRFGSDPRAWRFVCPSCGHVASVQDWKNAGAPDGAVAFSCLGRGELLSVGTDGARNVSFDPLRVLAWVQQATKAMQAIHDGFTPNNSTHVGVWVLGPNEELTGRRRLAGDCLGVFAEKREQI